MSAMLEGAATSLADAVLSAVIMFVIAASVLTYLFIGALRRAVEHEAIIRRPVQPAPGPSSTHSTRTNITVTVHGGIHVTNNGTRPTPSIEQILAELPADSTSWDRQELTRRPRWELDR